MPIKAIVSGAEKDVKRIPMKGRNLYVWPYTSSWGVDGAGQNRTVYNSAIMRSSVIKLKPNTQYTISAKAAGSNDTYCRIAIFDEEPQIGSVSTHYYFSSNDGSTTFTTEADEEWGIVVQNNGAAVNIDLKRMINEGSTPLPYEPYGYQEGWEVRGNQNRLIWGREETLTGTDSISFKGAGIPLKSVDILGNTQQTGTPSPDNIIMPDFCGVRTGNILDISDATETTISGVTYRVQGNTLYINGTSTSAFGINVKNTSFTLKAGTYTNQMYGFTGRRIYYSLNNVASTMCTSDVNLYKTFTISEDTTYANALVWINRGVTFNNEKISFALLESDVPNEFEPYGYKIPISCAGQTTPVYLGQTQTVRKIRKLVLTGEEVLYDYPGMTGVGIRMNVPDMRIPATQAERIEGYCTHFPPNRAPSSTTTDSITFGVASSYSIYILLSVESQQFLNVTSISKFKAWIADQYAAGTPVTIWYVLAEPETAIVNEPLCKIGDYADELSSTIPIPTVKGANVLTVDTTLPPSNTSITGHITSAS